MNARTKWLVLAGLLVTVSGCSGSRLVNATGRLTYKGRPVPSTLVTFRPADGGRPSHGLTDDDGNFVVTYSRTEKGITRGQHAIYLKYDVSADEELHKIPPKASKELREVISRYGDPEKCKLGCEITKDGQFIDLTLE
jgi:hypothetical protein